jgi:hypothetical protein
LAPSLILSEKLLASVRQLRAPISSRLTQFLSAKNHHPHQQPPPEQKIAAAASPKNIHHVDESLPPSAEQEAVSLALCQKHHERLRLLFGSGDGGEVVAEASAAVLLKDFCSSHGIVSPPSSVFVHLFRKYGRGSLHILHFRMVHWLDELTNWCRHGAAPGGINWYKAIEFICSGRSASCV